MEIPLCCPCCNFEFALEPGNADFAADSWRLMGDGQTVEDMLYTSLEVAEPIFCPRCGVQVDVSQADLKAAAAELLAQW
jgi:hypothetical protein